MYKDMIEEEELVQVNMMTNLLNWLWGIIAGEKLILALISQPLFLFMEGRDRVDCRQGGGGAIRRAFSASATCINRPTAFQVGCFAFFLNLSFWTKCDVQEGLRRSKSAEVFLFDTKSTTASFERDKVRGFYGDGIVWNVKSGATDRHSPPWLSRKPNAT